MWWLSHDRALVMGLSRSVEYAVRATVLLAQSDGDAPTPCRRIAAEGQLPGRFLLQILRQLVNSGILRSTRGVDGGYTLNRPPAEISLLDLVDAVDKLAKRTECDKEESGDVVTLRLHAELRQIADSERRQLADITVAHLALPPPTPAMHCGGVKGSG